MKKCQFCAEDIQDEARVCKHCGRDLESTATAQQVTIVQPPKKTSGCAMTLAILIGLFALVTMAGYCNGPGPSSTTTQPTSRQVASEPNEPCTIEAPAEGRAAAQAWCDEGSFTKVSINSDTSNFIVLLQFSKKGQSAWRTQRTKILSSFRDTTNDLVEKAQMNVAISLHGTDGQMVGGCARKRTMREASCNP